MAEEKDLEVVDVKPDSENHESKRPKKKNVVVTWMILLVGIALVCFAGYQLFQIFSEYKKGDNIYDDTKKSYVREKVISGKKEEKKEVPWYELVEVDFDGLNELNPDIVGWIYFENGDISYPILYSGDNETYLYTAVDKTPLRSGSIFMEQYNHPDFQDSHTIIYGHNMKDLSMFSKLRYYFSDEEYYDDHQYFQIITRDAVYRYVIFAYQDVPEDSDFFNVSFEADDYFSIFLDNMVNASLRNTGIDVTKEDKVITLSTCSTDTTRWLVHGKRVDTYE